MSFLARLHKWANHHEVTFILLALLLFLRLPNFAEPYWYGDEGIYLTIGTALRQGLRLYADTIDHKTPIIYWLAMTPTQLGFRVLLFAWMSGATLMFYQAMRRLLKPVLAISAAVLFVILTSLPAFEGNIPNGELFVMGFVVASLWLITLSQPRSKHTTKLLVGAGLLAGLGVLTKVPALLDAGALASLFWFVLLAQKQLDYKKMLPVAWFSLGGVTALVASILYFALRGTLSDYLQFGLLYNLHYTANWRLPFDNPTLVWFFGLPGKTLILFSFFALTSLAVWKKLTSPLIGWSAFWTIAALFAALLSNRPYPHYLLQVALPLTISTVLLWDKSTKLWGRLLTALGWMLVIASLLLLEFRPYPLFSYYTRFWKYAGGQLSTEEYVSSFSRLTLQNRQLAPIISRGSLPNDRIFIWGTNPTLYALTQRAPATRFTVSFHIHDLKAYDSTMSEIRQEKPIYIVVMKREPKLAGLDEYIEDNYFYVTSTAEMVLYRRFNGKQDILIQ